MGEQGHPGLREFGARVRRGRTATGLTQEEFAALVGLHRTYVGSVERGERNVGIVNIVRLAAVLGVDPGDLVRGIDAEPLPPSRRIRRPRRR